MFSAFRMGLRDSGRRLCGFERVLFRITKDFRILGSPCTTRMGQYKIDSLNWTLILFVCNMVVLGSLLVMVSAVFCKTQAQSRKSIFRVEANKNVALNHLELIRDKRKILFGAENSGPKW